MPVRSEPLLEVLGGLIDQVEEGDGPDRLLDGKIMFYLFAQPAGARGYVWPDDMPGWTFAYHMKHSAKLDRYRDIETIEWRIPDGSWILMNHLRVPALTGSLDAALKLLRDALPGFWWRGGTCALSSEAIVCPDHNCPTHGERLLREFPPAIEHWNEGIEVELRPGGDEALVRALLAATLRAYRAKEEAK